MRLNASKKEKKSSYINKNPFLVSNFFPSEINIEKIINFLAIDILLGLDHMNFLSTENIS